MQYVGDAVMAVFGAPEPSADHADCALQAALAMHAAQKIVNDEWEAEGSAPFGLGIGLSTGSVAAALLGSEERVEYTVVGDAVNLCQRLQQLGEPGQTVLSEPTWIALTDPAWRRREARAAAREGPGHAGHRLSHRPQHRGSTAMSTVETNTIGRADQRPGPGRADGGGRGESRLPHVRAGHRARAGAAGRRPRAGPGRVRGRHGTVGLRQVDAAERDRRPRRARRGRGRRRRRVADRHGRERSWRRCGASTSGSSSSSSTCWRA